MPKTVIGYLQGKYGSYEVFHKWPEDSSIYYHDSARSCSTGFRKTDRGYSGLDGSYYSNETSVISAIQHKYNLGKI